jgi:hypothetical protein
MRAASTRPIVIVCTLAIAAAAGLMQSVGTERAIGAAFRDTATDLPSEWASNATGIERIVSGDEQFWLSRETAALAPGAVVTVSDRAHAPMTIEIVGVEPANLIGAPETLMLVTARPVEHPARLVRLLLDRSQVPAGAKPKSL